LNALVFVSGDSVNECKSDTHASWGPRAAHQHRHERGFHCRASDGGF
jgi:hypothetical protein